MHQLKRTVRRLSVAVSVSLLIASSGYAQNVSVTDYDVPVSSADRFLVDVTGKHSTSGSDTTASGANVGGVYKRFYDSLPYAYTIDVIGSAAADKDIAADEYVTEYNVDAGAGVRKYLLDEGSSLADLFGSVRVNALLQKEYDQPASSATLGVGYGRFISATALAKAVRIEEFLLKEGELTGRLPRETMLTLSDVIYRRAEYEDRYGDTYKRDWYSDMEGALQSSGRLVGDELGPIGTLRIEEVLERERIADRFYGWDVTLGAKFDVTMPFDNQDRPPLNMDISANYARPIGWDWQISERLSVNTPVDDAFQAYTASLASDATYEMTNRMDFRLRHLITVAKAAGDGAESQVSNSLGAAFIYYLENQVSLVLSTQIDKAPDQDATSATTLSLNYRVF